MQHSAHKLQKCCMHAQQQQPLCVLWLIRQHQCHQPITGKQEGLMGMTSVMNIFAGNRPFHDIVFIKDVLRTPASVLPRQDQMPPSMSIVSKSCRQF
jgi:hypothetical protein